MSIEIRHATQTTKPNDANKDVSANAWNEAHQITGLGDAAAKNTGTGADEVAAGDHTHASLPGLALTDDLILPKTSGSGILIDPAAPGYGWRDLVGDISPKTSGPGAPTLDTLTGNIRWFRYSAGDDGDAVFHLPHDYAPGTDLYLHPHWTHNGTNISGQLAVNAYLTYAKGHQQANFHAEKAITIVDASLNITNTPALRHRIPEIRISTPGGSSTELNTNDLEVDGLILLHFDVATIPTITGGSGEPFLLTFDIHYQSTGIPTKNKAPSFYA